MTILESFRNVSSTARAAVGALAVAAFLPAASAAGDIPKGANLPFALKDLQDRSLNQCDIPYVVVTRGVIPKNSNKLLDESIQDRFSKAGVPVKIEFADDPVKVAIYLCGKPISKDLADGSFSLGASIDYAAASAKANKAPGAKLPDGARLSTPAPKP